MRKFTSVIVLLATLLLVACGSHPDSQKFGVGPSSTSYSITAPAGSDPCENPSIVKQSAPVSVTSATTTSLVTAVTGSFITVCKWQVSVVGTSPTLVFEYGTLVSTACDTGATALTGAMAIPTTTVFASIGATSLTLRTPVSQALCLVTGGTITGVQGYITYVQAVY